MRLIFKGLKVIKVYEISLYLKKTILSQCIARSLNQNNGIVSDVTENH
jgi:hypothetical protein